MRSASAFYLLLASGRLFRIPITTSVHALPCVQEALSLSSSSPYAPSCRITILNNGSGHVSNSMNELFSNTSAHDIEIQNSFTPTLILTIILFIVCASLLIVLLFFGPSIWSYLIQKMKKEEKPKLGFGFDGLSKQDLKSIRAREEQAAVKYSWFTRLPARPPALVLKHTSSPLLSIQIPREGHIEDFDSVDSKTTQSKSG